MIIEEVGEEVVVDGLIALHRGNTQPKQKEVFERCVEGEPENGEIADGEENGEETNDHPVLEVLVDAGLVIRLDGLIGAVGGDSVDNCVNDGRYQDAKRHGCALME